MTIRIPLQHCVVGKSRDQSRVVGGVVTALHPDMLAVSHDRAGRKLRIVVSVIKSPSTKPMCSLIGV